MACRRLSWEHCSAVVIWIAGHDVTRLQHSTPAQRWGSMPQRWAGACCAPDAMHGLTLAALADQLFKRTCGAGRDRRQGPLPVHRQPRAAHAAQRHHRHLGGPAGELRGPAGRDGARSALTCDDIVMQGCYHTRILYLHLACRYYWIYVHVRFEWWCLARGARSSSVPACFVEAPVLGDMHIGPASFVHVCSIQPIRFTALN